MWTIRQKKVISMSWSIDKKADEAVYDDENLVIIIKNMAQKGDDGPLYDIIQCVLVNAEEDHFSIPWLFEPSNLEEAVKETKKSLESIIKILGKAVK